MSEPRKEFTQKLKKNLKNSLIGVVYFLGKTNKDKKTDNTQKYFDGDMSNLWSMD